MNREFYFILLSVFLFIAVNTIFYFQILNRQLDFQTDLLSRQAQICGNTIEQEGLQFEYELHSIPYQDDFTRLFTDQEIRQRGSVNLQKLYAGYSQLINKITVYDNHNNVYSLILDAKNKFVSDYYVSQRQTPLYEKDHLTETGGEHRLFIPGFDENGEVRANIVVDINYDGFVDEIFKQYSLEHTLWQWLVTVDNELISTADHDLIIPAADLKRIGESIREDAQGSFVHSVSLDNVPTRVVSVYYPVRLVNRDLGIVFSIKSDLFLQSILIKLAIITFSSLLLLALLLYIHYRVTGARRRGMHTRENIDVSGVFDIFPFGLVLLDPDGGIIQLNKTARNMLLVDGTHLPARFGDLGLEELTEIDEDGFYERIFGPGTKLRLRSHASPIHVYKTERESGSGETANRLVMLIDISNFENLVNHGKLSLEARTELLENMSREISVPLEKLKESTAALEKSKLSQAGLEAVSDLKKAVAFLSNLVRATLDFASRKSWKVAVEEIPFYLRSEIDLVLDPFRKARSDISIITKIRNEVPEKLIGDPFRLRQATGILVENAVRLTSEGRILLSCEIAERNSGYIKLQFNVEDTGKGFPDGIQPGQAQDDLFPGMELARKNITLMKGDLWMDSPSTISTNPNSPGLRQSFTIEAFPGESMKENLVFKSIANLSEIRCLILSQEKESDNESFAALQDLGIKPGFLIYRKENIESVIALVAEKSSELHLIVVHHTPAQDGMFLIQQLVRKGIVKNQALILVSAVHDPENYARCRKSGVDYYLEEPVESYHFVEILSKHFPDLEKEVLGRVPGPGELNPDLSILLAEDNVFSRKVIQGLFKRLGYEIDLAENGKEAVRMVKENGYDLVFMDLLMPEMDGLQAVAEIRKHGFKSPVIALTADESSDSRKAAMEAGFDDYLVKPAMDDAVRQILARSST
jgi:CheY-like chemotaxis protein/signal transduction histidine kinase